MKRGTPEYEPDCDVCRALRDGDVEKAAELTSLILSVPGPQHGLEIVRHISRFAGPLGRVLTSDRQDVPGVATGLVNVLFFEPTRELPYRMLVTAGLSDLPFCPPPDSGFDLAWAELAVRLPADWRLGRDLVDESRWDWGPWYWPVKLLFDIASTAHREAEWLWYHHTMSFGDRPTLAENVPYDSLLFHSSAVLPPGFLELTLPGGKSIHFLSLVPLHPEELAYAAERGDPHALVDRLEKAGVTDLIVPGRASCV